jgi:uncharacterized repeat protein (TIGR03803 family)
MKPVHFVCVCWMLAGTMMLAQFVSNTPAKAFDGLPIAMEPQSGDLQASPAADLGRIQQTRYARRTLRGRPLRRNARPQVQGGLEQVLYAFQGGNDGEAPSGVLIFDSSGNLYGTTVSGGGGPCSQGCGAVFELSPNGSGGWTETILYSFQGGNDGESPSTGLIFDQAGNLYGTTAAGGSYDYGTAFKLSNNGGGGWAETVLYVFGTNGGSSDGEQPDGVIFDKSGNLYGTTAGGGNPLCDFDSAYCGTVFALTPNGSGGWTENIIYKFSGSDGWEPNGGLIFDQSGNLYGTTQQGGSGPCFNPDNPGCGTAFELSPNGSGGWTGATLHNFGENITDGMLPDGGMIFDQSGNLYGTTQWGGTPDEACAYGGGGGGGSLCGTVFELSPNGSGGWTESVLYSFQAGNDGEYPSPGLIFDQAGNLYGTTIEGGSCTSDPTYGCGTLFKLSPNGSGGWTESIRYRFPGGSSGSSPAAGVILDQTGDFYGTTYAGGSGCGGSGCGVVYEVLKEPFVTFSPASLGFGNQTVGIASTPLVTTLTNSGILPLTITSIQITEANSGDFGQSNNCPASLAVDGSCNISVTFTPTATGNRSAAVSVTDNAPGSPQSVPLTGVGVLPAVTFSPTSLNFGNQTAGTSSSSLATTLTNTGPGILTIASIGITGPNANEFAQTNNCPPSLTPNNSCNISVTFSPTVLGNANASLTVADNAPGSPQSVPLTGIGVSGISFSPPSVTFPNQYVGTSGLPQSVILTNTGDAPITISNVTASPSDFAPLSACGGSVPIGGHCSIGVFFDPTTSGVRNGVLTVTDSAINSPQTVPLTGMGEDFSVAPSSSSTATVSPGQVASYAVSVKPAGGFNQTVTLSCSGAPVQSSCSVSPSSVRLNGSSPASINVSVSTAGGSAALTYPGNFVPAGNRSALWLAFSAFSGIVPGIVLLGSGPRKRNGHLLYGVALLCMVFTVMSWSACGGGSSTGGGGSGGGTAPGTYNLTVVGTFSSGSGNLVHSTKLTLVVQ